MKDIRFALYKVAFHSLLRLPDTFYTVLFATAFPLYKALHTRRAYGRVVRHLQNARLDTRPRDIFKGIFWNALDSYRGLARFKSVERRIVYENEHIIKNAIDECSAKGMPIAAISIHQGPFELMHRALCRYSEHVHLITDSIGGSAFREALKEIRSDPHLTEYHPEETRKLIRDLFITKGILAMVVDQGRHTKGNTVELFGQRSTLYLRLPQKVNQMGAGIVAFRIFTAPTKDPLRKAGPIIVRFEKYYPPKYDGTKYEGKKSEISQGNLVKEIARDVERWISEYPDQWSWNYHGNFV